MLARIFGTFTLAADPELRFTQSGTAVVSLRAAANKNKRLQDGSYETLATHWANIQAWGPEAEAITEQAVKGDRIEIVGEPETQEWEDRDTGQKRSKDVINIKFFKVWKKDGNGNGGGRGQQSVGGAIQGQQRNQGRQQQQRGDDPWGGTPQGQGNFANYGDDEPPF
ncbi:ssDNA-binding protein [Gordonia phage Daredevil]|uniref:SsDNA binding protein n=1 Tax=Gordonia phage Daredevil TaxID=2283286 RepID=A0A345MIT0_9CAUD|nr:ssDNA-binding protein [Gordonia phage Daredevil]AXH70461.1 ssDNA binding protein [Gordonia phage Daredevil]